MRIHRLHVSNFRAIGEQRLDLAPSGVTVILGPNEAGKSSLVEALDLLFEFPDSSQAERVRAVQPVGRDVGSEVAVEGETGPYRFRYRKRFHRDRETVLEVLEPAPEEHAGREAHDRMTEILEETLDRRLWEALWVEQGRGFDQAQLAEAQSLLDALDRAAGGDTGGGEREENLFERVKKEAERFYTEKRGSETGDLRVARQEAEAARETEERLAEELADLEADAERFDALEARRRDLAQQAEAARQEAEAASQARRRVAEMRREVTSLGQALESREDRLDRFRDLSEAERAEARLTPTLRAAQRDLAEAERVHEPLRERLAEAREAAETTEAVRDLCRRDEDLLDRRERLDRARRSLEQAKEAGRRVQELEERLESLPVCSRDVERVEALGRRLREAEAARAAGSPELVLRPEAELTLEVAGEGTEGETVVLEPGQTWSRRSAHAWTLRLPGVAEVELIPGGGVRELDREVEALRVRLGDAVREVVGDRLPSDAEPSVELIRDLYARRREAETERDTARAARERALDGRREEELERRVEKLELAIAGYLDERPSEPPPAPNADAAREAHGAAEERWAQARRELAEAEAAEKEAAERSDRFRRTVERLELELETVRERAAQARDRLVSRGELPAAAPAAGQGALFEGAEEEDPLTAALAAAERARDEARRRLAERERELEEADPAAVEARAAEAEERHRELERERERVDRELAELHGRLEALGRLGLFERHEEAAAAAERAEHRLRSVEARARAARRLYDTLAEAREEARRSYHRPLAEKIGELGRSLYGDGFEVRLSDDLAIAERVLDGRRLPFEQLSTGAREQLALLARLASALLVAPEGGGAPLILDDVLGHTDPERLAVLRRILATAGEQCQVVILTSDPERYGNVAGAHLVRLVG